MQQYATRLTPSNKEAKERLKTKKSSEYMKFGNKLIDS
jgi:hypothetical protein